MPKGRWRAPSDRREGVDGRLDKVVEKALQPEPDERFSSAREFRKALDSALAKPRLIVAGREMATSEAKSEKGGKGSPRAAKQELQRESEGNPKPVALWVLSGVVPLLAIALFFVVRGQRAKEEEKGATPKEQDVAQEAKPEEGEGVYAAMGDRLNEEISRRNLQSTEGGDGAESKPSKPAPPKKPDDAPPVPAKSDKEMAKSPVPPEDSNRSDSDSPGPPMVGRWRPLLDDRKLNRDGTLLENGDAFLAPCKAAQAKLKEPIDAVLVRWRGFRGNSMSVEYHGGNKGYGRRSFHVGSGGGTQSHLGPASGPGAARSFDSQWFVLIRGNQKHVWEVADGKDPAVSANVGEVSAATDIKELKITTWNPHYLPYFKPALIRRCDTLIPTEEQLAELLAARTTAALLDLPWVAQPKDEAYDAFLDAVDEACGKLAVADFRAARSQAETLLAAQPLLKENPHREILEFVRDTAAALIAIDESTASKSPWPELKGNRQYRLDPATGHAFVSLPLLLTANEAAAFAQKTPGHLATLAPAEETQRALADAWLVPTVPLGIVTRREGRFVQGWHLGGMPRGNSGWSWITGEPLPAGGVGASWRSGRFGYDPQMATIWELGGKEAENKRRASLGWETISASTRAFALIEFPALATRYPNPQWNHPAARNEAPGSTGDPLVDFENRFTHQWRETVTKPWSAIDGQLRDKYATALESRARTIAQAGTLDAVLPWHFEIKTVREGGTPPPLDANTPEELRRLRTVWDAEAAKVAAQR
ncbi:MAG: hypothetical protein KDL87_11040, partial [Verrucomicrobiae bacterium]|nr:hypothetical protein [Verrucomicrobiae bacterium]